MQYFIREEAVFDVYNRYRRKNNHQISWANRIRAPFAFLLSLAAAELDALESSLDILRIGGGGFGRGPSTLPPAA